MIKTKTLSPFSLTVCTLLALCGVFPAFGNALPETAKLLPPETVMLMEIKDFTQLRTQFEKTSIYQLYKNPAMAGFVEDLKNKWLEKTRQLDNTIFKSILEAKLLPSTRVSLAAIPNPQAPDSNEPPVLFLSQWGANIDKIREAAEKMSQKAIADGFHKKTENYRDISIEIILNARGTAVVNYCFIKDCLILSTNPAALKFLIAHLDGAASATLADEPDYSTAIKAVGPYHDIDFYINTKKLISAHRSSSNDSRHHRHQQHQFFGILCRPRETTRTRH
jgi:hypothetical protein